MQPEELFGLALSINLPWYVGSVVFSKELNRLDINIDFKRGATFVQYVGTWFRCMTP
jgi:hypothetical protein